MIRTLADEMLAVRAALADGTHGGVRLTAIAAALALDWPSARHAAFALDTEGLAKIAWRGRALHLLATDDPTPVCIECRSVFERHGKSKRLTCSRSCAVSLSWKNEDAAARRRASIRADRATPAAKARLAAHNKRRWAKPEEHTKLSEQNRKQWADPEVRAKRSIGIQRAHSTPQMRKLYADLRRKEWQDPKQREKRTKALRKAFQSPEYRAKFSAIVKARWKDPAWRAKWTAANKRKNDRFRGKKLTPEEKQRRREARERNKAARSEGASA